MEDFIWRAAPWANTLVRHDWPLFVGMVAVVYSAVRLFVRPSRRGALFLYGWLTLVGAFEYQKHGVPIITVTTNYLFSTYANPDWRHLSQIVFREITSLVFYVAGFLMLVLALAPIPGQRAGRKELSSRGEQVDHMIADGRKTI